MKKVIHWRNIAKWLALVVSTGVLIGILSTSSVAAFFFSMLGGGAVTIYSLNKWELFHFEIESKENQQ